MVFFFLSGGLTLNQCCGIHFAGIELLWWEHNGLNQKENEILFIKWALFSFYYLLGVKHHFFYIWLYNNSIKNSKEFWGPPPENLFGKCSIENEHLLLYETFSFYFFYQVYHHRFLYSSCKSENYIYTPPSKHLFFL